MGTGDWNDGMNQVGGKRAGRKCVVGVVSFSMYWKRFAAICEQRGDRENRAAVPRNRPGSTLRLLSSPAWDGDWYRRAYYDDGFSVGFREEYGGAD